MIEPKDLDNITPALLDAIEVVEREDKCNSVRSLPKDATLRKIVAAARKDARDLEQYYLELAHFASDLGSIAENELL